MWFDLGSDASLVVGVVTVRVVTSQPSHFQPIAIWLLPNPSAWLMQLTVGA